MSNIKCYPIQTFQNNSKTESILSVYKEYKRFAEVMMNMQYREWVKTGSLKKYIDTKKLNSKLSERYKRNITVQVCGMIQSWILNKIIKEIKPKEIVLERLDFRHSKLNKTMNRILRKCGRSVVKSKLAMLEKDYGVKITEVNPAYTSQACGRCGFVHRKNRTNRDKFKCKICDYITHADINASKNIEKRRSSSLLCGKSGQRIIKKHLFDNFKKDILQCGKSKSRFLSPNSRAMFLDFNRYKNELISFDSFFCIFKSGAKLKTITN